MEHGLPDVAEVKKEGRKNQITWAVAVHQPVLNCQEF